MSTRRVSLADAELNVAMQGAGRPLLLVHGFPLRHEMWESQLAELSDGCQVIAPDLRGFGGSSPASGTLSMAQMADDLAHLLEALDIRAPVVIAGHSMGGYIAWEFWRRHSRRVAAFASIDSRAAPDTPEAAENRKALAARARSEGIQAVIDAFLPKLLGETTIERRPELRGELERMMATTPAETAAAALVGLAERADARPWLEKLDVPSLFLTGAEDGISKPEENREMARLAPRGRFVEIAAAGHMAPWEAPEPVNRALWELLEAPGRGS